ncbi:MAG: neuraminidase (sialidase)-like protein [Planctomycetota bacterium]|nr:MAG: neuraminidase (sialidase)-like protein [Planctomycetota bacterium]
MTVDRMQPGVPRLGCLALVVSLLRLTVMNHSCRPSFDLRLFLAAVVFFPAGQAVAYDEPFHEAELIFPLDEQHNHAPGVAELENGELIVSWYRGSGERTADDVAVYGSRRERGDAAWTEPEVLVDTPGFPDCNTCLMVDDDGALWLFWPVIIANTWESCLTHYLVADDPAGGGVPEWTRNGTILLKPDDFEQQSLEILEGYLGELGRDLAPREQAAVEEIKSRLGDKLYQRLGWQPRCKPTVLPSGRILLPLYSDTYSFSIMAISDDDGASWSASEPLIGFGNIQPAVLRRSDGTLVAYMRENGPRDRIRVAESTDDGLTWGPVGVSELPNPGSGLDGVVLESGAWLLIYNDSTEGRSSLAASLSDDEGRTWTVTRHLERDDAGRYHYPCVIQGRDGTIHCVYSYFVEGGKSMKHAAFNEAWVRAGD